ncbi:hypothetical protein GOA89_11585 [Sinorhizobium meliloti]|nr:hypothetical protein [Sinorhizobium meliloti]MDW9846944.1 hypothetical protein [Sinorhizobium meliloti]MDX0143748.1 hypothetical protein [Sinorhizobium meliloti]MDX0149773.1 hypothetical protein [Sinorhizobium meliloti]MDX0168952.1 hypothetical protein [Sinorhizobium meliloti]
MAATEFNDAAHWGFFMTGTTLTSSTGKYTRVSELTLAALRAQGIFDNMVDGTVPPAATSLWLDKNTDPAVLKEWDATGSAWVPMTFQRLFGRAIVTPMATPTGTADALVVAQPNPFIPNRMYSLTPVADNTGAVTIQVAAVATFSVTYTDGSALEAQEFKDGNPTILLFTGARFEVLFKVADIYEARDQAIAVANALPPIAANRMLVDNAAGTVRETKTFPQVRDLLDPVNGFNANGQTSDTANFAALESVMSGRIVDGRGAAYKVSSIPTGNDYQRIYWVIDNADDGATIYYPGKNTLVPLGAPINLMPNDRYVGWPQGGPAVYNNEVLVKMNSGAGHEDTSQYVLTRRSGDGGASFKDYPKALFQRSDGKREMSMAADNVDGQWLMSTFLQTVGGAVEELKLYGKRAAEYRQWGGSSPNPQIRVTTTNGSPNIVVYDPNHGVKPGDRVRFEQASATVGGLALSGVMTVVEGGETNFTVLAGSNATADDKNIDLNVTFIEDDWAEITFSGISLGSAIVAASGLGHTMPTQVSGIAGRRNTAGDIFVTIHGGGVSGPCLVGINNIFRTGAPRAVASVARIGGLTEGLEASIDIDHATGDMFGAIRTEGGYPYRRWYLPFGSAAGSAVTAAGPASPFGAASPIGIRKVPGKNAVFGIMSGSRLPATVDVDPVIGLYLLYMTWDDFKNPASAGFQHIYLQDLHYTDYLVQDRNGNGVPGIYVTGDGEVLGILWSDQFQAGTKDQGGQPSTFLQRLYIGPEAKPHPVGMPEVSGWFGATPVPAYWPPEDVTTLSAHFNTDGSLVKRTFYRGLRLAGSTTGTGVYPLTFQDAEGTAVNLGHTNYYVVVTTYAGAHYCAVWNQTSTGFEVRTYDAAGAAVNRQFMVDVRIDNEWSDNRD